MRLLPSLLGGTVKEFFVLALTHPDAVIEKDVHGRNLWHHAMMLLGDSGGASTLAKLMWLVKNHPAGALERDATGSVPLHYACRLDDMNVNVSGWTTGLMLVLKTKRSRSAMHICDSDGRLPLHRVILAHRFNVATVMLQTYYRNSTASHPPALVPPGGQSLSQLPPQIPPLDPHCSEGSILHLALKYDAPDTLIQLIVKKLPHTAEIADQDGDLALHAAIDYRVSLAQIQAIQESNPLAISTPGDKNYLPHHLEASIGGRLPVLQLLQAQAPSGYMQRESSGCLPIHVAVRNASIEPDCLDFLNAIHPNGLSEMDTQGFSALHLACIPSQSLATVSLSTLQWLLRTRPSLIEHRTADSGLLPLHVLAQSSQNVVDALNVLGRAYPLALETADVDGHVPLHYAVMTKEEEGPVSLANVECLLKLYPESISSVDCEGRLPFHIACANPGVTTAVMDLLCKHYPRGMSTYDACGLLPLHYAATTTALDFVWSQLDHGATSFPPSKDGVPALFLASEMDAPLDVLIKLVECSLHLFM